MNLKEEIKKSTVATIVGTILAPILLLISTLIAARIPLIRDRIWPATPKWLLMVLLVVFLSISFALFRLLRNSRRTLEALQIKATESEAKIAKLQNQIDNPPRRFMFSVWWDKDLIPYCNAHRDTALGFWTRIGNRPPGYLCPIGGHLIHLQDDNGNLLTPVEAKQLLEKPLKPLTSPLELREYEPNEKHKDILRYLYKGADRLLSNIADAVGLDQQETKKCLNELSKHKYVLPPEHRSKTRWFPEYSLTDKGIEFVINNDLRD